MVGAQVIEWLRPHACYIHSGPGFESRPADISACNSIPPALALKTAKKKRKSVCLCLYESESSSFLYICSGWYCFRLCCVGFKTIKAIFLLTPAGVSAPASLQYIIYADVDDIQHPAKRVYY